MDTAFGMRLRKSDAPVQAQNDAMKTLALILVFACAGALAQTAVPGTAPSAPRPAKPAPRLMTPAEARDSATAPGELRPERPVVPQISIPLGKTPPRPAARVASASTGAIHDATARCKALESESERAKCLTRIALEPR
jgi:hypothetical protein